MATSTYDLYDTANIGTTFTVAGVATDPTLVTFRFRPNPGGTLVTYTYGVDAQVTKSATGVYACALLLTTPGKWLWKWKGTNAVATADTGSFWVLADAFD